MSQEQRDSYVIPPNFIEGGSFFGGLFKARNVVEAVILAAGTGLPILTLSLTLTVRIILLCLTSLPLALLALIGIAGMPLSSYIILFFRFLRNRRSLSQSGGRSSRKQAILPTWDKKSGPSTAVQPAAYKKDGSRIRFAKDTRRLMLDTSYRQKKQAERPGNPLAAYVPIQKIENGIVYTTDHRFIKILEIVPINFLLRSAREQRNIVYSFISYLKIAPVKLQIKVITKRADMNRHIETVRREMAQETNESCRMQQEDYLKLLKKLGSREAIARRFFLIMEYEPLPGAKKDREEADAISSLQTAARTAANYLRQCGNSVVQHENEDEAAAEMLYTFLCRRESTDIPFLQRISHITSNYIKSGCSIDEIPVGDFFAPSQLDFTHGSYLCIDGTYYAYLLVPSDGYKSEVPAGWLSLLVNAGDGIDLDVFLTRQPKDRMIRKLGQQLRINRSKIKETSDTNTDFDDLDSAIRSGYFLKDGLSNHEDFYYLNLLITVTADNPDDLDWKCAEMKKLLISQDMNVQSCNFCQEQALRSSFPLVKLDKSLFERSKRNVLTLGAASCYPFTAYELCDDNGILLGVNKHNNSLIIVDIFDSRIYKNANIAILGTSGSGKTFTMQLMALRMRRKGTAQTNADAMQLLLRHVNHRISAYLKSVYPSARWEWTTGNPTALVMQGGTGRIRVYGIEEYDYADVQIDRNGNLSCNLLKVVPVQPRMDAPTPPNQQPVDPQVWYDVEGREVLERVIADLDSRGHSSLTLKEDGSVCVHEDDDTKDIPQEHLTAFPPKVYWPRLGQVLESEGLSARVQDNEIAVSW